MAKKENNIPAIIDTPEALEAKIAAMKEAQKFLLPIHRSRLIRFSKQQQLQQIKHVSRLPKQLLKKQEWVS